METKPHFYSNPAFCQQSEFINGRPPRALSPQGSVRHSPVGAQTISRVIETFSQDTKYPEEEGLQEQEFYEEVVVDDQGFITDKKFVVVAQNNEGKKYIRVPQSEDRHGSRYGVPAGEEEKHGSRYGVPQTENLSRKGSRYDLPQVAKSRETKLTRTQSHRYEYIPMQEQDARFVTPKSSPRKNEDIEVTPRRVHRYEVICPEQETELTTKTRYALVPVNSLVSSPSRSRYEYPQDVLRPVVPQSPSRYGYPVTGNPAATQKLHEYLSTPKKSSVQLVSPQPSREPLSPTRSPISKETYQTKPKPPPKAQQKLNYALGTRQMPNQDKRNTAIVLPVCSSPIQSIYSETTYSNKSESWMNLSVRKDSVQVTLAFAAFIMLLCGVVAAGMGFYMISLMGRHYFLDFGIVAGFTCLILGMLGLRSRNIYWLPNRNYISGYLLLAVFSMLTCAGLVVLLVTRPRPGTPLADITSGAVCGVSVFSLVIAMTGVISSYCCKYPPPDNRVQHCARGFSV